MYVGSVVGRVVAAAEGAGPSVRVAVRMTVLVALGVGRRVLVTAETATRLIL